MKLPTMTDTPAQKAASTLINELGTSISSYTFVEFCAGAGGPTPFVEPLVNQHLTDKNLPPVDFVLTDLYPNVKAWEAIARDHPRITFEPESVDASKAPARLVRPGDGRRIMRLFNLSFHHFDDTLAKAILKDTVETSEGFAIFELQDRYFLSFLADTLLPFKVMFTSPYYAFLWRNPIIFIFNWIIPIVPLVLFWDGWVSSLRTREPSEVEVLLRNCGADATGWQIRSGKERFLWPCGHINWIICKPQPGEKV